MVHTQASSLGEAEVLVAELAQAAGGKNAGICGLEIFVNNQTTIVDEAVVMN